MLKYCCLALMFFVGCQCPPHFCEVKIVKIENEYYYRTVVEFPDRTRRVRDGLWGNEGDKFIAYKKGSEFWASPKIGDLTFNFTPYVEREIDER